MVLKPVVRTPEIVPSNGLPVGVKEHTAQKWAGRWPEACEAASQPTRADWGQSGSVGVICVCQLQDTLLQAEDPGHGPRPIARPILALWTDVKTPPYITLHPSLRKHERDMTISKPMYIILWVFVIHKIIIGWKYGELNHFITWICRSDSHQIKSSKRLHTLILASPHWRCKHI